MNPSRHYLYHGNVRDMADISKDPMAVHRNDGEKSKYMLTEFDAIVNHNNDIGFGVVKRIILLIPTNRIYLTFRF